MAGVDHRVLSVMQELAIVRGCLKAPGCSRSRDVKIYISYVDERERGLDGP